MKYCIYILLFSITVFGQSKNVSRLDLKQLPAGISPPAKIIEALQLNDISGKQIIIFCETGIVDVNSDEGYREAKLYAVSYSNKNNQWIQNWKVYDFVEECPVDVTASFKKASLKISDLDNDGIKEVWMAYTTTCRGDVSPADMKVIMYEGNTKYAMRGTNKVKLSEKEYLGGEYTFDNAFLRASEVFRKYAISIWNANVVETWN